MASATRVRCTKQVQRTQWCTRTYSLFGGRIVSWIIYCWLVRCERKTLFPAENLRSFTSKRMLVWVVLFVAGRKPERWSPLHHHNGGSRPGPEVKSRCRWSLSQERETGDGRCLCGCSLICVLCHCDDKNREWEMDVLAASSTAGQVWALYVYRVLLSHEAPTTGIGGGEPTALYCINYCLVFCHCQGSSNVKWLLLWEREREAMGVRRRALPLWLLAHFCLVPILCHCDDTENERWTY